MYTKGPLRSTTLFSYLFCLLSQCDAPKGISPRADYAAFQVIFNESHTVQSVADESYVHEMCVPLFDQLEEADKTDKLIVNYPQVPSNMNYSSGIDRSTLSESWYI